VDAGAQAYPASARRSGRISSTAIQRVCIWRRAFRPQARFHELRRLVAPRNVPPRPQWPDLTYPVNGASNADLRSAIGSTERACGRTHTHDAGARPRELR
jgi:hypothetical protein